MYVRTYIRDVQAQPLTPYSNQNPIIKDLYKAWSKCWTSTNQWWEQAQLEKGQLFLIQNTNRGSSRFKNVGGGHPLIDGNFDSLRICARKVIAAAHLHIKAPATCVPPSTCSFIGPLTNYNVLLVYWISWTGEGTHIEGALLPALQSGGLNPSCLTYVAAPDQHQCRRIFGWSCTLHYCSSCLCTEAPRGQPSETSAHIEYSELKIITPCK